MVPKAPFFNFEVAIASKIYSQFTVTIKWYQKIFNSKVAKTIQPVLGHHKDTWPIYHNLYTNFIRQELQQLGDSVSKILVSDSKVSITS